MQIRSIHSCATDPYLLTDKNDFHCGPDDNVKRIIIMTHCVDIQCTVVYSVQYRVNSGGGTLVTNRHSAVA